VERLLASGDSALYDRQPEALHQELARIQADLERPDPTESAAERSGTRGWPRDE
jgi:hypothetical protein